MGDFYVQEKETARAALNLYNAALGINVMLNENLRVTGTTVRIYPEGAEALGLSKTLVELTAREAFALAEVYRIRAAEIRANRDNPPRREDGK